jgi:hypothetical protein
VTFNCPIFESCLDLSCLLGRQPSKLYPRVSTQIRCLAWTAVGDRRRRYSRSPSFVPVVGAPSSLRRLLASSALMDAAWTYLAFYLESLRPQLGLDSIVALGALALAVYSGLYALSFSFRLARFLLKWSVVAVIVTTVASAFVGGGARSSARSQRGFERWVPSVFAPSPPPQPSDLLSSFVSSAWDYANSPRPVSTKRGRKRTWSLGASEPSQPVSPADWMHLVLQQATGGSKNLYQTAVKYWNENTKGQKQSKRRRTRK